MNPTVDKMARAIFRLWNGEQYDFDSAFQRPCPDGMCRTQATALAQAAYSAAVLNDPHPHTLVEIANEIHGRIIAELSMTSVSREIESILKRNVGALR